jgi:hypothetical protein
MFFFENPSNGACQFPGIGALGQGVLRLVQEAACIGIGGTDSQAT